MRKLLSLLLAILLIALCGCTGGGGGEEETTTQATQETVDPDSPLCDGKTLKILAVTSSFGLNTTQFLYDIAVAEGCTDVVVGRLYASGCTLEKHVTYSSGNVAGYEYTKNDSGQWDTIQNATMEYGLQDEDWDIIFVQQSAAKSPLAESYGNYVDTLMAYLNENKTNPNARFVWNMTWAYQGDSDQAVFVGNFNSDQMLMYETIVDVVQEKIVPRTDFAAIIPTGTAVQNARTSYIGDTLTKDTYHLNNLGRAIAGYTLYAVLTGEPLTEINLGEVKSYDITGSLVLTQEEKQVIIEAVNAAIASPWEITQSSYTG